MVDILHRVGVDGPTPEKVYEALTTIDGLAGWWTTDTIGDAGVGGRIAFWFPPGGVDMEVVASTPGEHVEWKVVDGPEEWVGTTVDWRHRQEDERTIVLFQHKGWKEAVEFMHHCSTKWATYLVSLKQLVETGPAGPPPTTCASRSRTDR